MKIIIDNLINMDNKLNILIASSNYSNSITWELYHFYEEIKKHANVTMCGPGYEIPNIKQVTGEFDWSINCQYLGAKSAKIRTDNHKDSKCSTPYEIINQLNKQNWDLVLNRSLHFTYPNAPISLYSDRLNMPVELLLWSFDKSIFSYQETPKIYDIFFAGACSYGTYPLRNNIHKQIDQFTKDHRYSFIRSTRPPGSKGNLNYITHHYKYVDKTKHKLGQEYVKALQQSKLMLTSGSIYRIPVKKYFETIATGCLLLADKTNDWDAVGLNDGETFVEINEKNWKEKVHYYINNNEERIRIIRNARKLFEEKHTNTVRAKQLIEILKTYL